MPWKECSVVDERMQFVARRLAGEAMAELCREFGISRKTGYKIFHRYQECGIQGLTDRSRRPCRYANQLPFQVENFILNVKREHASWGARKIRERLIRRFSGVPIPAKSTIHAVLDRYGLVERRGRLRRRAQGTPLSLGQRPKELWCTDYKGEFLLGNHQYCYPLTVTDHASRYLLRCEALSSTRENYALPVFERLLKSAACPPTSAATTVCPSLPRMPYSTSASSLSGGSVWASASNASSLAIPSKTAVMNAAPYFEKRSYQTRRHKFSSTAGAL
jgi:transposase